MSDFKPSDDKAKIINNDIKQFSQNRGNLHLYKISEEVAQDQLDMFLDYYEFELESLPSDQRMVVEYSLKRLNTAIRKGFLEIKIEDDTIKVTQILKKPPAPDMTQIVYAELSGKHKIAMRDKKNEDQYGRMYSLVGSMTGFGETFFYSLKGIDISIAECLGGLFLLV